MAVVPVWGIFWGRNRRQKEPENMSLSALIGREEVTVLLLLRGLQTKADSLPVREVGVVQHTCNPSI